MRTLAFIVLSFLSFAASADVIFPVETSATLPWYATLDSQVATTSSALVARRTSYDIPGEEHPGTNINWLPEALYFHLDPDLYFAYGWNVQLSVNPVSIPQMDMAQAACLLQQDNVLKQVSANADDALVLNYRTPMQVTLAPLARSFAQPLLLDNRQGAIEHEDELLSQTQRKEYWLVLDGASETYTSTSLGLLSVPYLAKDKSCHVMSQANIEKAIAGIGYMDFLSFPLRGPAHSAQEQAMLDAWNAFLAMDNWGNRTVHQYAEMIRAFQSVDISCGPDTVKSEFSKDCRFGKTYPVTMVLAEAKQLVCQDPEVQKLGFAAGSCELAMLNPEMVETADYFGFNVVSSSPECSVDIVIQRDSKIVHAYGSCAPD